MHITLFNVVLLIGIIQGLIITCIFLFRKNAPHFQYKLFSCIVFILSWAATGVFLGSAVMSKNLSVNQLLLFAYLPFYLIMPLGPLLFFLTKSLLQPDYKFSKKQIIHFYPVLIDLFPWLITYLFLPFYAFTYYNEQQAYGLIHFLDQYNTYVDIPRYFSILIYTFLSWKMLLTYRSLKNKAFRWARFLVVGFSMILACWTPFLFLYISPLQDYLLQTVYYYPIYYPVVGFIYWISIRQINQGIFGNLQKSNYADTQNISSCIAKMQEVMLSKQLYLNPELRLEHFCQEVELPTKIVSQIFNRHLHKGFNDFVNKFRVEDAKIKLADRSYQHLTLEGIALEVGFASRSTFLRAFKKVTEMSPSNYKQKLDANPDLPPEQ